MERGSMCRQSTRYMGLELAKAPHHSLRVKFPSDFSPVQGPSPRPHEVTWSLPCCCSRDLIVVYYGPCEAMLTVGPMVASGAVGAC